MGEGVLSHGWEEVEAHYPSEILARTLGLATAKSDVEFLVTTGAQDVTFMFPLKS